MGLSLVVLALIGDPAEPPAFRIEVAPPAACKRATTCEAKLRLVAINGFKVNGDYPFKFAGDASPSLVFDGTGTFTHDDKTHGTLTIKFRSDTTGKISVAGLFKLSVCNDAMCKIERPKVSFVVPVT
jgi:hypothetical protein